MDTNISHVPIRCRVAACREARGEWAFYLVNDGNAPLDSATLTEVVYEWGDWGSREAPDVRVEGLGPGGHERIWQCDGEVRTELRLLVRSGGREARLTFEFPKLYIQRNLRPIAGLDRTGWEEAVEA